MGLNTEKQVKGKGMKKVKIRYCNIWLHNRLYAARVAKYMKTEADIDAELDAKGKIGELTFWVGDKLVEQKGLFLFPDKKKILDAVQAELRY